MASRACLSVSRSRTERDHPVSFVDRPLVSSRKVRAGTACCLCLTRGVSTFVSIGGRNRREIGSRLQTAHGPCPCRARKWQGSSTRERRGCRLDYQQLH